MSNEQWTAKAVKNVLVDSYSLLGRTGGKIGPTRVRAFWPAEYKMEQGDFVQQSINSTYRHRPAIKQTTARQQSCMEIVVLGWRDRTGHHVNWFGGPLLLYPDYRDKLVSWVFAELRGVPATVLCERRGWSYATFKRHRDKAAQIVADRLNRLKVDAW